MQLQPMSRVAPFVAAVTTATPPALPGTGCLRIRRLGQDGRAALARHLIGLPEVDRRTRFSGSPTDACIERYCEALDLEAAICFAALDEAGAVVGAALGFPCGGPSGRIEVAVTVAPDCRQRGLGSDLVARVCGAAAARGATAAAFEFDPCNAAIRGLVRHFGAWLAPQADGCVISFQPAF